MVTSGTYRKLHHFRSAERLSFLQDSLLRLADEFGWNLQAWAVFSNHYHFVAVSPAKAESLKPFVQKLHSETALAANDRDKTPERQVWFQYWETRLTFQKSYLARLGYVHCNAVHHGLVREPPLYLWCSAAWFEQKATTGRLRIPDEFEVQPPPES